MMLNRTPRKRGWRDDSGAAMVEFAIVLPLILLLLFGIMEFGRAWNVKQVLTDAAREGARVAVVTERGNLTQEQLETLVETTIRNAAARAALDSSPERLLITADQSTGVGGAAATPARVSLEYEYVPLFGTWVLPSSLLTLHSSFVMRNE
jgi:Flp pilus assembly protein TadG